MADKYTYVTRKQLKRKLEEDWAKKHFVKYKLLNDELKSLTPKVFDDSYFNQTAINERCVAFWNKHCTKHYDTLADFIEDNCSNLVKALLPKEEIDNYYDVVNKLIKFPYSRGMGRRTLRTKNFGWFFFDAMNILYLYHMLAILDISHEEILTKKTQRNKEEELDFINNLEFFNYDYLLMQEIDKGNEVVIDLIKEAILSEKNNVVVTWQMISAISKCENTELHELLCKLLVSARLQEGLRQSICENGDSGTKSFFEMLLKTIQENNLLRFSSVKRAISTWCGIFDPNNPDRITDKVFSLMLDVCKSEEKAYELCNSNDSIKIMIGLWGLGYVDVDKAIEEIHVLAQSPERNTILTAGYYSIMLDNEKCCNELFHYVSKLYPLDKEIISVYISCYITNIENKIWKLTSYKDNVITYNDVDIEHILGSSKQAKEDYNFMKNILLSLDKKKYIFSPIIFPWFSTSLSRSELVVKMVYIAYALKENDLIDDVCQFLSMLDSEQYYSSRARLIQLLLHNPQTQTQKNTLLLTLSDKSTDAVKYAYKILNDIELNDEDYQTIEPFLKYKNENTRLSIINLIKKRNDIDTSILRMIKNKDANISLAALDLIKGQIEKDKTNKDKYLEFITPLKDVSNKHEVIVNDILKDDSLSIINQRGFNVYNPDYVYKYEVEKCDLKILHDYFSLTEKELSTLFDKMEKFLDDHGNLEYVNYNGDKRLLRDGIHYIKYKSVNDKTCDKHPFKELWIQLYEEIIKDEKTFFNLKVACSIERRLEVFKKQENEVFGACNEYRYVSRKYHNNYATYYSSNAHDFTTVLNIIQSAYDFKLPYEVRQQIALYTLEVNDEEKWAQVKYSYNSDYTDYALVKDSLLASFLYDFTYENDLEYKKSFDILYRIDKSYNFYEHKNRNYVSKRDETTFLSIYSYIFAYTKNIIPIDVVYQHIFDDKCLPACVYGLSNFITKKKNFYLNSTLVNFDIIDEENKQYILDSPVYKTGRELFFKVTDIILDVELKRSETKTIFSDAVVNISRIYGMNRLFEILKALDKDTLDRSAYYYYFYSNSNSRKYNLCYLLKNCYPLEEETFETFKTYVDKLKLKPSRLAEIAMYAPQWMDYVQQYLEWPDFKSGCYYFIAHMNERFEEDKLATIARYTPLTAEELNDGCFDSKWFYEVFEKLGEDRFDIIYDSAKYIADGNKHSRARKYADAAINRVTIKQLEEQINDKRNKDLLMSYGIVPISDEKDKLHRYEFLQKFLKESKQFGAQRRASEAKAVETALKNLATTLDYADSLRLTLAMESALVKENQEFFETTNVDGYDLQIVVDEFGKSSLSISKDNKVLKSVPANLKNKAAYLERKEFITKLKNQYSRCISMFENSMENKESYTTYELKNLLSNPVIKPILSNLVFTDNENSFLLEDINDNKEIRFAHPYDLYKDKSWSKWQKYFFEKEVKQPFKQVFRELYLQLDEEKEALQSRMFAGNQIQVGKTVATLKSRKWVVDGEEGLQKVYYKDNIIATIYALADWFSPSDVEPPTLEYVCFYDRKSYNPLIIKDIDPIIYSEVMRDTDLAVSVAHAGGVDPETSHSTIEMRKVIAEFNAKLFKLNNVTFEKSHAIINGKFGTYTVQLGSGVIHKDALQINILPVHSQSRGKVFLPFIDEDPKTAEIISKIILLAQDDRIKDPYIINQINA